MRWDVQGPGSRLVARLEEGPTVETHVEARFGPVGGGVGVVGGPGVPTVGPPESGT